MTMLKKFKRAATGAALIGAALLGINPASAAEPPIKVGVLHSLSGTMAISETTLKDTVLMMVAEQNAAGGLLGRQLEAVVALIRGCNDNERGDNYRDTFGL